MPTEPEVIDVTPDQIDSGDAPEKTKIDPEQVEMTDTGIVVHGSGLTLADVFKVDEGVETVISAIEDRVKNSTPDLSTLKGREAVRKLAADVSRAKTKLDAAGEAVKADAQAVVNAVNADRRKLKDRLDALRDEARKPLTEWEQAEEARKAGLAARLNALEALNKIGQQDSAEEIQTRIDSAEATVIDDSWDELEEEAARSKEMVLTALRGAHAVAAEREAERAELEALREAARKREEEEAAAQAAEEQRRREEEEAQRAKEEEERRAREAAEAEERQKREAAEAAQRAAEEAAQRERDEADRLRREAEEQRERERAEEAKRIADAEAAQKAAEERAARAAQEERDRQEQERKDAADAEAKRRADAEHREKVVAASAKAITGETRLADKTARKLIEAIAAGKVPSVSIKF